MGISFSFFCLAHACAFLVVDLISLPTNPLNKRSANNNKQKLTMNEKKKHLRIHREEWTNARKKKERVGAIESPFSRFPCFVFCVPLPVSLFFSFFSSVGCATSPQQPWDVRRVSLPKAFGALPSETERTATYSCGASSQYECLGYCELPPQAFASPPCLRHGTIARADGHAPRRVRPSDVHHHRTAWGTVRTQGLHERPFDGTFFFCVIDLNVSF